MLDTRSAFAPRHRPPTPVLAPAAALAVTAFLACGTAPAIAWDGLRFDPAGIAPCIEDGDGHACIGQAADACMAASEGGYSNLGMVSCIAAELDWWDGELNAVYRDLRARERQLDTDWSDDIPGLGPRPSGADTLRDVQRAWIGFRDASCTYEALDWWGGSGARLIEVTCRLQMTAEQTLRLRGYLAVRRIDE